MVSNQIRLIFSAGNTQSIRFESKPSFVNFTTLPNKMVEKNLIYLENEKNDYATLNIEDR